jgi:hypothetical protein
VNESGVDVTFTTNAGNDSITIDDTYYDSNPNVFTISYDLATPSNQGFDPVGKYDYFEQANTEFTGSFDGQNHTISNLSINRLDDNHLELNDNYVGLFGRIGAGGEVKNVGVINVNITGNEYVGGLVGFNYKGTVSNSYSTGNVTGESDRVGGLVGRNGGTVSNSYSTGNVTGESYPVGGLVGNNYGTVSNSYSTGNVTGESYPVGGLVGTNEGTVSNSYSTGNVTGEKEVGGLVGSNYGTVSNSYSTGNVTGEKWVGGLIGYNYDGTVSNSYSTGNVTGDIWVGGIVGENDYGTVSNSYWDTEATGQSSSEGLPDSNGLTTSEMQGSSASSSMSGFDFTDTWSTVEGDYPELQWQEYRADVKFFIVLLWYTVMCFLISGIILMEKRR